VFDQYWISNDLRLTWQPTPRNKFSISVGDQIRCVGCTRSGTANSTSEASGKSTTRPNMLSQATWTSPWSNRVLLEAGGSATATSGGASPGRKSSIPI
jgi:hypothetical protein